MSLWECTKSSRGFVTKPLEPLRTCRNKLQVAEAINCFAVVLRLACLCGVRTVHSVHGALRSLLE